MTQEGVTAASVLKIMISTDNHLGVWERDERRYNDSFETFEEVFKIAQEAKVDMVLLGGDLFHDNKPSRSTLVKCLDILNRYCLNDNPINFEVVSKPEVVQGTYNTQSETINVGLPIFTIHGNHDDPAGPEDLSAVDILSTIQYVNYFGKQSFSKSGSEDCGRVEIKPLLLKKARSSRGT